MDKKNRGARVYVMIDVAVTAESLQEQGVAATMEKDGPVLKIGEALFLLRADRKRWVTWFFKESSAELFDCLATLAKAAIAVELAIEE